MACDPIINGFLASDGTMNVSEKYLSLMQDTLDKDSLYARMKDTMYQQFKDLQLSEKEKAGLVTDFMTKFAIGLADTSMTTAVAWAKEERDGAFTLAKIKADTEASLANFELIKANVCKTLNEEKLVCAQTMKTTGDAIRDNGSVATYAADGCTVATLVDEGTKYEQTQMIIAETYTKFADAYRKSGVVQIGVDVADGTKKGLTGDSYGYTHQQIQNAERMRIAYEDSKRNHAANSAASMIGQMLSAEIAPNEADVERWRDATDYLNVSHSTTSNV